jgi:hypothetical protein
MMAPISVPWRVTSRDRAGLGAWRDLAPTSDADAVYKVMAVAPLPGLWTPEVLSARAEVPVERVRGALHTLAAQDLIEVDPTPAINALRAVVEAGAVLGDAYSIEVLTALAGAAEGEVAVGLASQLAGLAFLAAALLDRDISGARG